MYNLVIMDANRNNRLKIRHYIDEVKDRFKILSEVATPAQAERLVESREVDIIIGDDAAQGMTGIQLFGRLADRYPMLRMILFTDHDPYSHSKETLAQGRVDYLYKPVRKNDVITSLNHMARLIDQSKSSKLAASTLRNHYEQNIEQFRERFLMNLIYGSIRQPDYIYSQLDYFGIPYTDSFAVAVFKIDDYKRYQLALEDDEQQFLIYRVYDILRQGMSGDGAGLAFISRYDEVTLLFTAIDSQVDILDQVSGYHKAIYDTLEIMGTMGVGRKYNTPQKIHLSYNQAVDAVLEHNYLGKNTVIHIDFVSGKNDLAYAFAPELENMLVKYALSGQVTGSMKSLRKIWQALEAVEQYDAGFYKAFVRKLVTHLYRDGLVYHYDLEKEVKKAVGTWDSLETYSNRTTLNYMEKVLKTITEYVQEHKLDQDQELLENAMKYVQAYHTSRISLSSAAQYLETTPKHLEEIFYKVYEQNFYDYCMMVRIENAKDLLISTRMSTGDVARTVGFSNAEYFIAMFKKNEQITPTQYRHQDKNTSALPLSLLNGQRLPTHGHIPSKERDKNG